MTTSRRSSAPCRIRWIACRVSYTVAAALSVMETSPSNFAGVKSSLISLIRKSSFLYSMVVHRPLKKTYLASAGPRVSLRSDAIGLCYALRKIRLILLARRIGPSRYPQAGCDDTCAQPHRCPHDRPNGSESKTVRVPRPPSSPQCFAAEGSQQSRGHHQQRRISEEGHAWIEGVGQEAAEQRRGNGADLSDGPARGLQAPAGAAGHDVVSRRRERAQRKAVGHAPERHQYPQPKETLRERDKQEHESGYAGARHRGPFSAYLVDDEPGGENHAENEQTHDAEERAHLARRKAEAGACVEREHALQRHPVHEAGERGEDQRRVGRPQGRLDLFEHGFQSPQPLNSPLKKVLRAFHGSGPGIRRGGVRTGGGGGGGCWYGGGGLQQGGSGGR